MRREHPNIVFIAIDTLRPDHLSCYGYPQATSPHLDELARGGLLFTQAFAAAVPTHPSFANILTGMHPLRTGITAMCSGRDLPHGMATLAELLAAGGYATGAVDNLTTLGGLRANDTWSARGYRHYAAYRYAPGTGEAAAITDGALRMLGHLQHRSPFFLFLHYFDPHIPYRPPAELRGRFYRGDPYDPEHRSLEAIIAARPLYYRLLLEDMGLGEVRDARYIVAQYDAEIAFVDREVGRLLEGLHRERLDDDTIVVVMSDHGEVFGEGPEHLFFDHYGLSDACTRIALFVSGAAVPQGRCDALVTTLDVVPSILELAGLEAPEGLDGMSVLGVARGELPPREHVMLLEHSRQASYGLRTRQHKLVLPVTELASGEPVLDLWGDPRSPAPALFRVDGTDPLEHVDVAAAEPDTVAAMVESLGAAIAALGAGQPDPLRRTAPTLSTSFVVDRLVGRMGPAGQVVMSELRRHGLVETALGPRSEPETNEPEAK